MFDKSFFFRIPYNPPIGPVSFLGFRYHIAEYLRVHLCSMTG